MWILCCGGHLAIGCADGCASQLGGCLRCDRRGAGGSGSGGVRDPGLGRAGPGRRACRGARPAGGQLRHASLGLGGGVPRQRIRQWRLRRRAHRRLPALPRPDRPAAQAPDGRALRRRQRARRRQEPADVGSEPQALAERVRAVLPPTARIVAAGLKPSIRRWAQLEAVRAAPARWRAVAAGNEHLVSGGIEGPLLGAAGHPWAELFAEHGLSGRQAGYAIWAERRAPHLD